MSASRDDAGTAPTRDTLPTAVHRLVLGVAVARYAVPWLAIPLVPLLVEDHLAWLVLLRPMKEFLLLGGGVARVQGTPSLWALFAAYVPLMLLAVWVFFVIGRVFGTALRKGTAPAWLQRLLRPNQIDLAQRVLTRRGPAILVLGRLAAFPPTVLAAAAGVSGLPTRHYLAADTLGAVLAFGATVGVGYGLGEAWEQGVRWLGALGLVAFVGAVALLTVWVRREAARGRLPEEPADPTS